LHEAPPRAGFFASGA